MMNFVSYPYWLPVILLSLTVGVVLLLDSAIATAKESTGRMTRFVVTLLGTAATAASLPYPKEPFIFGHHMMIWDALSFVTLWIALLATFFVVLLTERSAFMAQERTGPYYSLLLLATTGLYFLSTSNDLIMIFLAMELVAIPLF